jgi:hypothetical protein
MNSTMQANRDRMTRNAAEGRRSWRGTIEESVSLLVTPTSQLSVNGGSQDPAKRKAGGHGPTLADQVEHLLPTPTAQASKHATDDRGPGSLNDFNLWTVARRIGDHTPPLSPAGNTS